MRTVLSIEVARMDAYISRCCPFVSGGRMHEPLFPISRITLPVSNRNAAADYCTYLYVEMHTVSVQSPLPLSDRKEYSIWGFLRPTAEYPYCNPYAGATLRRRPHITMCDWLLLCASAMGSQYCALT